MMADSPMPASSAEPLGQDRPSQARIGPENLQEARNEAGGRTLGQLVSPRGESASAPSADADPASSRSGWLGGNTVLSTLSALGIVLGLIYATRWIVTRLGWVPGTSGTVARASRPHGQGSARQELVEVLHRTSLAPRNDIVLLRVGSRVLVTAETPQGMTTLATIDRSEEVAAVLAAVDQGRPGSFTSTLRGLVEPSARPGLVSAAGTGASMSKPAVAAPPSGQVGEQLAGLLDRLDARRQAGQRAQPHHVALPNPTDPRAVGAARPVSRGRTIAELRRQIAQTRRAGSTTGGSTRSAAAAATSSALAPSPGGGGAAHAS